MIALRSAPLHTTLVASTLCFLVFIFTVGFFVWPSPHPSIPVVDHGTTHVEITIPNEKPVPISSIQEVFRFLYAPLKISPSEPSFTDDDGTVYKLPEKPLFTQKFGKDVLILDLETRALDKEEQLMYEGDYDWTRTDYMSGGFMNHYTYAMIHGYSYKFIRAAPYTDRHNTWIKPSAIANVLNDYKFVVFLDSDAAFHQMHVPIEWLLNYWQIDDKDSIAMALDPAGPPNDDSFNRTLTNTGFMIVQRSDRTQAILRAWHECPTDKRYPGCSDWKMPRFHEQSAFGEFVRYDYEENIKELPCTEANGYPGTKCKGVWIRHYWYGKDRVRNDFANSTMQAITAPIQRLFATNTGHIVQIQESNEIL